MAGKIDFEDFAKAVGQTTDDLMRSMKDYNASLSAVDQLTPRTIEKMRSGGISGRTSRTRGWMRGYTKDVLAKQDDLTEGDMQQFLVMLEAANNETDSVEDTVESEGITLINTIFARMAKNESWQDARRDFRGLYWIVRQTTVEGENHFYKEPFYFGDEGEATWLVPDRQSLARGFTFGGVGVGTAVMEFQHSIRGQGLRVITLYQEEDPTVEEMSGVMLRYSDDAHRPVASRILALRINDPDEKDRIWAAMQDADDILDSGDRRAVREKNSQLNGLAQIVTADEHPDEHAKYTRFEMHYHAKAIKKDEWDDATAGENGPTED